MEMSIDPKQDQIVINDACEPNTNSAAVINDLVVIQEQPKNVLRRMQEEE